MVVRSIIVAGLLGSSHAWVRSNPNFKNNKPDHRTNINKHRIAATTLLRSATSPSTFVGGERSSRPRLPSGRLDPALYPTLTQIKKAVDPEAFKIDIARSLAYFFLDLGAIAMSSTALLSFVHSPFYLGAPQALQFFLPIPLQIISGTFLWAMWCVGHDAGHGTISSSKLINGIVGEVSHSMICLTPFDPWRRSHKRHHMNHNHLTKDYSHQWFDETEDLPGWIQASYKTRNFQLPILYLVYLLAGIPDGGHVFLYGRVWEGASSQDLSRGYLSSMISVTFALGLLATLGVDGFLKVVFAPWLVMSTWLFTTTYLQHHSADTKLYTDDTWSFTVGGFETIDRDYGSWVNKITHNMSSDHVAHHLFPWSVPHYNLPLATKGIKDELKSLGLSEIHQEIPTKDFPLEIVRQFDQSWFWVKESSIVRECCRVPSGLR